MNHTLVALLAMNCLAPLILPGSAAAQGLTLTVATSGKDSNPGSAERPLATIKAARDRIRDLKKQGAVPPGGVAVEVRGGVYEWNAPLQLTAADSGTAESPIVYRAVHGESVRLVGGKRLTGFSPVTDTKVLDMLEEPARAHVLQTNLRAQGITDYGPVDKGGLEVFYDNKPMTLARWPNEGFTKVVSLAGSTDPKAAAKIGKWVYEGDRPERWVKEQDPWVHGYWMYDWAEQASPIKTIDLGAHTIEVKPPYHNYGYKAGQWYYAFNLLSELDFTGEWYLDREKGILYFWPPAGHPGAETVVSVIPTLFNIQDASHISLEGFTLEAARATSILINNSEQVAVAGCTIRNVGGWGVNVSGGHRDKVVSCDIYGTGEGGISLEGGDRRTLTPSGHVAENNHIHDYARVQRVYKPGISLNGVGNTASHNLIHDAPHMAIGLGGNDETIEFNEIYNVCEESNDAGAIYGGRDWTLRGNIIRDNFLHHISGFRGKGAVGVYLDDTFSSAAITDNIFWKVHEAIQIGGGRDNSVINNILMDCPIGIALDARGLGWAHKYIVPGGGWDMQEKLAAVPYTTAPWTKYPDLANILTDEPYEPRHNVVTGNIFGGITQNRIDPHAVATGTIKDNLVLPDPGFVDAANGDFHLRPDSPALAAGFKPIPINQIGLQTDQYRPTLPARQTP